MQWQVGQLSYWAGQASSVQGSATSRNRHRRHTQPEAPIQEAMRCALPEHIADQELTANQERVRFIARDAREYAEKAPAGLKLVVVNQEAANTYHDVVVWVILDKLKSKITVHDNL